MWHECTLLKEKKKTLLVFIWDLLQTVPVQIVGFKSYVDTVKPDRILSPISRSGWVVFNLTKPPLVPQGRGRVKSKSSPQRSTQKLPV